MYSQGHTDTGALCSLESRAGSSEQNTGRRRKKGGWETILCGPFKKHNGRDSLTFCRAKNKTTALQNNHAFVSILCVSLSLSAD